MYVDQGSWCIGYKTCSQAEDPQPKKETFLYAFLHFWQIFWNTKQCLSSIFNSISNRNAASQLKKGRLLIKNKQTACPEPKPYGAFGGLRNTFFPIKKCSGVITTYHLGSKFPLFDNYTLAWLPLRSPKFHKAFIHPQIKQDKRCDLFCPGR